MIAFQAVVVALTVASLIDAAPFSQKTTYLPENCYYKAKTGDWLYQHYNGTLEDGTIFDTSYQRGKTFNFRLNKGYVIDGMDMGMEGMCKGERREIIIPPELAYGDRQRGNIPPGSTLYFSVELVDIYPMYQVIRSFVPDSCTVKTKEWDRVSYHYTAKYLNGVQFLSSYGNRPVTISVGHSNIIKGIDDGFYDMCVGEKRELVIGWEEGFGEKGHPGSKIPPRTSFILNIELVENLNATTTAAPTTTPTTTETTTTTSTTTSTTAAPTTTSTTAAPTTTSTTAAPTTTSTTAAPTTTSTTAAPTTTTTTAAPTTTSTTAAPTTTSTTAAPTTTTTTAAPTTTTTTAAPTTTTTRAPRTRKTTTATTTTSTTAAATTTTAAPQTDAPTAKTPSTKPEGDLPSEKGLFAKINTYPDAFIGESEMRQWIREEFKNRLASKPSDVKILYEYYFLSRDENHDMWLTQAEFESGSKMDKEEMMEGLNGEQKTMAIGERPDGKKVFHEADSYNDGYVSLLEMTEWITSMFQAEIASNPNALDDLLKFYFYNREGSQDGWLTEAEFLA